MDFIALGRAMFTGCHFKGAAIVAASLGGAIYPAFQLIAATDAVKLEVTGAIAPSCTSSISTATFAASDITKAGSSSQSFTVDCNAPFQYSMQSQNGALRLMNAPASGAASIIETPYDVHIRIPLTLGGAIDDICNSATIKQDAVSCNFTNSGRKIAVNQLAEILISWNNPRGQLTAGQYGDQLSFSVSVKP